MGYGILVIKSALWKYVGAIRYYSFWTIEGRTLA